MARSSTMASSPPRFAPPIEGFITAQEVRNIRAQLRRMSEPRGVGTEKGSEDHHRRRVDTEHRGVTGTAPRRSFSEPRHPHFNGCSRRQGAYNYCELN